MNLIVCQIKGEYQFTYLEHALCVGGGCKEGLTDLSLTRGKLPVYRYHIYLPWKTLTAGNPIHETELSSSEFSLGIEQLICDQIPIVFSKR